jgi:large subunit ribosomal protein L21
MYAIIRDRGKQHTAREGETLTLDILSGKKAGDAIEFNEVLLVEKDGSVKVGTPLVQGAKVRGTITSEFRDEKIDVVRFVRKEDKERRLGHRQPLINVKIEKIEG